MASDALNGMLEMLMSEHKDVRHRAFLALAQLSGTTDGITLIRQYTSILSVIVGSIATTAPQDSSPVLPTTLTTLTNIAATPVGATIVMAKHTVLLPALMKLITAPDSSHADRACGLLANLTRESQSCRRVMTAVTEADSAAFPNLLTVATNTAHNTCSNTLHLLMFVIENISQLAEGRKLLLDHDRFMIQRLLPFIQYPESTKRRRAVVATLHNCCFQKEEHMWLLGAKVELASYLCLPLAGPDSFTDEESGKLPDLLVYLPDTKKRESSPQIRLLLLKALTQLCTTRPGREELRNQNVYLILRELHKWEEDMANLTLLEDLVNMLIRTEEEIGAEDISTVEVSEDMKKKFIDMDKQNEECPVPPPALSTEEEIGAEDISTVEVPEDMKKKFIDMDKQNEECPVPPPALSTEEEIGAEDISTLEVPEDMKKKFTDMDKQNEECPLPPPAVS